MFHREGLRSERLSSDVYDHADGATTCARSNRGSSVDRQCLRLEVEGRGRLACWNSYLQRRRIDGEEARVELDVHHNSTGWCWRCQFHGRQCISQWSELVRRDGEAQELRGVHGKRSRNRDLSEDCRDRNWRFTRY